MIRQVGWPDGVLHPSSTSTEDFFKVTKIELLYQVISIFMNEREFPSNILIYPCNGTYREHPSIYNTRVQESTASVCVWMHMRELERDLRAVANIREDYEVFYRIKISIGSSELNRFPRVLVTPCYQNRTLQKRKASKQEEQIWINQELHFCWQEFVICSFN